MSGATRLAKGLAIAGAAAGAAAGSAWAIERAIASRRRGRAAVDIREPAVDDPSGDDPVLRPITLANASIPTADGGTINFIDTATKNPSGGVVVLVHGVTLSMRTWVRQLDALPKAGLRVVAYDQRGHGASTLGGTGFSVPNLGDDLAALLEGLDLDDVVLVGHSMGGIAVQSFVARHPEMARARVRGIVLLSTLAATLGGSQAAQLNQLVERVTRRTPDSSRLWAVRPIGLRMARVGFGSAPQENDLELVRQMLLECSPTTRAAGPRSLIGFDLTAELDRIDIPTVVVCGTKDVITPPTNARLLHERIADSKLELLDGGGHMLMLERAGAVNEIIERMARTPRRDLMPPSASATGN
ncbi:MAG TPA: alpha/beta hydrolase [Acidimicrobiia bacterium]|jgi:pimeloyl-ACP methyl ester carboxylesterase